MKKLINLLQTTKLAIFDLDGVIYRGNTLLPGVKNVIKELKNHSIKVLYNTNNSTATREMYVDRLNQLGIQAKLTDFYTSAFITAEEITELKESSCIFVIGEIGLKEELRKQGHKIISESDDYKTVDFIIVGLDREFNYNKLKFAQKCILEGGAKFFATNNDATLPMDNGLLPGAGVMVNALKVCTNQDPIKIYGKPNPDGILKILKDHNITPQNAVIFGDRLDTDIVAGNRANIRSILVLTGVTKREDADNFLNNPETDRTLIPDLIVNSLEELFLDE